ncbi:hypothetical protein ACDH70_12315 [Xanthomonas axonopodis pv. poinsettiicola]|uniref:hypothetical protein n=1 Tax=Xanthomonas TaxID=338 RepID=UPI001E41AC44|nr:hypothetical protein [Xanthomonas codiaei]MCC8536053.1 hypothetical protein [Xanthomonas codiaei]
MNIPKMVWYQLGRAELPEVAIGIPIPGHTVSSSEPLAAFNPNIAGSVGFAWNGTNSLEYHPPAIFVLQNQNLRETLSWLRVYARETFPLSQFGRVVTMDDWQMFIDYDSAGRSFRDDRWASVVLGELLAQSDQDQPLESLPVARAQACFSMAIARTQKLYDSYKATRACTDRLRAIESDPRFLKRAVSVDSLVPAWSMASASFANISSPDDLAEFIISAADSIEGLETSNSTSRRIALPSAIFSDSIEERVVAFQQVANEATNFSGNQGAASTHAAAVVAAGAFLVGRGTSHAFLIRKYARLAPVAHIWFGVMAGIAGPMYWDPSWAKLLKGIEKHIRASFCWSDPPLSDFSWAEYEWVSNAVKGQQAFSGMSRQASTSISIEVLPGASCQMRLHIDESKQRPKEASQPTNLPPQVPSDRLSSILVSTLEEMVKVSERAREILSTNSRLTQPSAKHQSSDLFKEEDAPRSKRASKKHRPT